MDFREGRVILTEQEQLASGLPKVISDETLGILSKDVIDRMHTHSLGVKEIAETMSALGILSVIHEELNKPES